MNLIKFTRSDNTTRNNTIWGLNVTNSVAPELRNPKLCSEGLIHAYKDLDLALIVSVKHDYYPVSKIWEAEGIPVVEDWDKVGVYELTTVKEIPLPTWYTDEAIRSKVFKKFALLCARAVLPVWEEEYPNDNRPRLAIESAELYYKNPTEENRELCEKAARAIRDSYKYPVARAAASAANASAYAAYASYYVAYAAYYVHKADHTINLSALAEQAIKEVTEG